MWHYVQRTGDLIAGDGEIIAGGYAGNGTAKNNPDMDNVPNRGPLPRGRWKIGPPRDLTGGPHGPYVLPLTPSPKTDMHGRMGFLVHGDSIKKPGTASNGCIIEPLAIRKRLVASGDPDLLVIPDLADLPT